MQIDIRVVSTVISDLGNGYRNGALLAAHLIGGVLVAIAIDNLAHKFFDFDEKNAFKSNLTNMIAFSAATAASFYLAPHSGFVKFSAGRLSSLSILFTSSVIIMINSLKGLNPKRQNQNLISLGVGLLGIAGMISGPFGHRSLISAGAIGSGFYAFVL